MYQFTTYDIVSEVAALTGKVVRVRYGQGYSISWTRYQRERPT